MNLLKKFIPTLSSLTLLISIFITTLASQAQTEQSYKNRLAGKWIISSVNGTTVNKKDEIYLTFDLNKKRFYGSTGCNTINGEFSPSGKSLSFNDITSTQRFCQKELGITNALKSVKSYTISSDGDDFILSLLNPKGKAVITLHRKCLKDLHGAWKINHIVHRGQKIKMAANSNNTVRIILDSDAESLRGNTGYNAIRATFNILPDNNVDIDIYDIETTTQLDCQKPYQEKLLRMAFESVTEVIDDEDDDGNIELADRKRNIIINMSKANKR